MKARVSQLHKTEAEWYKFSDWTPNPGEIIIYDPDNQFNYARIKIGDGNTTLKNLPFFIDSAINTNLQKRRYENTIDGGRIIDLVK